MNRQKQIDIAVFLLRVVAGFLFIEYGGMKLFGWFGGSMAADLPPLILVAGIMEFVGGIIILLGLWVRPVAFLLSGEMAAAYFMGHAMQGFWFAPMANEGSPSVLFCFIFLFFAAYGAGIWKVTDCFKK